MAQDRLVWSKAGDCLDEVNRMCEACRRDRGRVVGDPDAYVHTFEGGRRLTLLYAGVDWWNEYLAVHRGWNGPLPESEFEDLIDPLSPLG